jgi:hypothetical protein
LRDALAVLSVGAKVAGNFSAVRGAEAVGKTTDIDIARRRPVRIVVFAASVLVGSVAAVLDSVTEESLLEAVSVSAGQVIVLADRLVRAQQRLDFALPGQLVAVVHCVLPVAGLLLEVEGEAGWTTDGLEARARALYHVTAVLFAGRQTE